MPTTADGIVVINRIKAHQVFKGDIQSGLNKMLVVGLGKQKGADAVHASGRTDVLGPMGDFIRTAVPVLFGVAILENSYDETRDVAVVTPDRFTEYDIAWAKQSRSIMPKIPIRNLDLVIVEQMGKDVSGSGMDTNVIGFTRRLLATGQTAVPLAVLELTEKTEGNAMGIGLADLTTRRLVENIDYQKTYTNVLATGIYSTGRIPLTLDNEKAILDAVIGKLAHPEKARVIRLKNTLELDRFWATEALREELLGQPELEIEGDTVETRFDERGDMVTDAEGNAGHEVRSISRGPLRNPRGKERRSMPMMKAIVMERPGGPEVLRYVDVPMPEPAPGQVLVRAHAIGVGMPEVLVRRGQYGWMPPLPAIPGIEMSGVVEKLGAGVTTLTVGQAVFVSARELKVRGGCYAEYIAAEAEALYPLPEGIDLDAAAALSNYQVAWHLLHSAPNGMRYESFMATAAAGGVGSALVQLGKLAGKRVIGMVDTDERVAFVLSLGGDGAINCLSENVTERVRALTAGRGVDMILDSIGGEQFADQFERLAPFGMVVSFGFLAGPPGGDVMGAIRKRITDCLGMRIFSMHAFDQDRSKRRGVTEELFRLAAAGKIKPPIFARLPLAEAGRAQALIEEGKVQGKVILKP